MEIIIVRHGETQHNKAKKMQGSLPGILTEKGKNQARQVAESLKQFEFTHIYCSSLNRAKQTAEILSEVLSLPITIDGRLDEKNFGVWENRSFDELMHEYPELEKNFSWEVWNITPDKAEPLSELTERAVDFLTEMTRRHRGSDRILAVSHGGPMRVVLGFINGGEPEEYMARHLDNGQVIRLRYEGSKFILDSQGL